MPKHRHQTTISLAETKPAKPRFLNPKEDFSEVLIEFLTSRGFSFFANTLDGDDNSVTLSAFMQCGRPRV